MDRTSLIACLHEKIEDIDRECDPGNDYATGKKDAYKNVLEWLGVP